MRIPFKKIRKEYDIIIVGAGITGLTILDRLLHKKKKFKILVLDTGSMLSKDPYPTNLKIKSKNFKIKENSRYFGVGGGSNVWLPSHGLFDKNKIEYYFKKSQFPINYQNYLKYINIASKKFKTPKHILFKQNKKKYKNLLERTLIVNDDKINFFSFSSILESKNVDFLENFSVKKLILNDKLDKVIIESNLNKSIAKIFGKNIILSSGTLECIRILNRTFTKKPKNLGKGFMNHPRGFFGFFKLKKNIFKKNKKKINNHLSAFTGLQLKSKSKMNTYLRVFEGIHFPIFYKLISFCMNKSIVINHNFLVKFIFRCLTKILRIIDDLIIKYTKNNFYSLMIFFEMERNDNNIVELCKDQLIVDYQLSKNDLDNAIELLHEFQNQFKVKLSTEINYKNINNYINLDASHHMGGIGMGDDENFIVNKKYKLKKSKSTYITGGAVFNFSDSVNPTLTYIALSLHLADEVYKNYRAKN